MFLASCWFLWTKTCSNKLQLLLWPREAVTTSESYPCLNIQNHSSGPFCCCCCCYLQPPATKIILKSNDCFSLQNKCEVHYIWFRFKIRGLSVLTLGVPELDFVWCVCAFGAFLKKFSDAFWGKCSHTSRRSLCSSTDEYLCVCLCHSALVSSSCVCIVSMLFVETAR